jgi:peptidoglycan hydrolase-like protein with peptidoglycan-binding domain
VVAVVVLAAGFLVVVQRWPRPSPSRATTRLLGAGGSVPELHSKRASPPHPGDALGATTTTTLPGLGPGSTGPDVLAIQQRLAAQGYDVGPTDGVFDVLTTQAVIAFEKVAGLPRSGRATTDVVAALDSASLPAPLVPGGGPDRIEIDLGRQVLFLYKGGALARILPVSSGSGRPYCENGNCGDAVTHAGSFQVGLKIRGLHVSPLGQLWNPLFFDGGIAIHGSPSVPTYPASHGCVRIPMSATEWFFDAVPGGTPVYVVGGPRGGRGGSSGASPRTAGAASTTTSTTRATPPTTSPTSSTTAPPPSSSTPTTSTTAPRRP